MNVNERTHMTESISHWNTWTALAFPSTWNVQAGTQHWALQPKHGWKKYSSSNPLQLEPPAIIHFLHSWLLGIWCHNKTAKYLEVSINRSALAKPWKSPAAKHRDFGRAVRTWSGIWCKKMGRKRNHLASSESSNHGISFERSTAISALSTEDRLHLQSMSCLSTYWPVAKLIAVAWYDI